MALIPAGLARAVAPQYAYISMTYKHLPGAKLGLFGEIYTRPALPLSENGIGFVCSIFAPAPDPPSSLSCTRSPLPCIHLKGNLD